MEILLADINDISEILDLQKISYKQEAEIYNDYQIPPLTQTVEEIENEFNNNTVLKAVIDDIIVGSVRAYIKKNKCYIGRLIVHPNHQNKGIGTKLMNKIEKYLEDKGIVKYELFTGEKSQKNIYLYQKLGYKIFKSEKLSDIVIIVYFEKEIARHGI
ncbi:hypothetical protein CHISP_3549 [Chitinispirillum alkaliphilum]|nr:hypothetical protein CHISP_3549 [Chitinispirillum alkaliphilum]